MANKTHSQKGSTHVVIIAALILIIIGVLGFVFWQNFIHKEPIAKEPGVSKTDNPTKEDKYKGWKVYSNYEDNYGIKYPSDWIFTDKTASDGIYIRNFDPLSRPSEDSANNKNYPKDYINLRVIKIDGNDPIFNGSTAAEWYEKLGKSPVSMGPITYSPDTVRGIHLQNKLAKTTKAVFTETNEDIFLLRNNTLYQFNLYPYGISDNETVKKILDSFFYTMDPKDAVDQIQH